MNTPIDLIRLVEAAGGRFEIAGDRLGIDPKETAAPLREELVRHKEAILSLVREREFDRLRPPFVEWFNAKIHPDAKSLALRQPAKWTTTVRALHSDFCGWMFDRDQAPPTSEQFLCLLRESCCTIRVIGGEQIADHVALKDDVQAHEQFEREPPPEPRETAVAAAAADAPAVLPDGTPLPAGCRLIRCRLVEPPIPLSPSETVLNVGRFVQTTLRQLANELDGNRWLAGNWGLQGLLARLEACGVVVEVLGRGRELKEDVEAREQFERSED